MMQPPMQQPPFPQKQPLLPQAQPQQQGNLAANLPPELQQVLQGQLQEVQASPEEQSLFNNVVKEAMGLLYQKGFQPMVEMIQTYGPERFDEAIALAVVTALNRVEERHGPQDEEIIEGAMEHLIEIISNDMEQGGVIPELTEHMLGEALAAASHQWVQNHPSRSGLPQGPQQPPGQQPMQQQQPQGPGQGQQVPPMLRAQP